MPWGVYDEVDLGGEEENQDEGKEKVDEEVNLERIRLALERFYMAVNPEKLEAVEIEEVVEEGGGEEGKLKNGDEEEDEEEVRAKLA